MASFEDYIASNLKLAAALDTHTAALNAFVAKAGNGGNAGGGGSSAGITTSTSSGSAEITKQTLTDRFGAYLKVADDGVRNKRIADMGKLNKFFGVAKLSDGPAENWPKALQMLDQLEAGGNPFPAETSAESLI